MSDQHPNRTTEPPQLIPADMPAELLPFAQAMVEASFTTEEGRTIIHCVAGLVGAAWDLASALAFLKAADQVTWEDNLLRHELGITSGGMVRNFDVRRPTRD